MTQETIIQTIKQCKDNYLVSAHSATIVESCKDALIAAGYKIYICTLSWDKNLFPYPMDLFEGVKTNKDIDDTFEKLYWMQNLELSKDEIEKNADSKKYYELSKKAFRLACHGALERYGELTCWNVKDEMIMLGQYAHDMEWEYMPKSTSDIHEDTPKADAFFDSAFKEILQRMNDLITTSDAAIRVGRFSVNASEDLFQELTDFVAEAGTQSSQIIGTDLPMLMYILTEMFDQTLKPGCTLVSLFDAFEKLRQDKTAVFIETEDYPIADCVKVIKTE